MASHIFADSSKLGSNFKAKSYKAPLREISVIATDDGYFPNKLMAFVGEQVRLYITSSSNKKDCLILQQHEVFLSAQKGVVNETLFILDKPGRYRFYCPSSKNEGHLTVIKKDSVKETVRSIAGEKLKPTYWTPRDYDE
jgi:hypothetical protein